MTELTKSTPDWRLQARSLEATRPQLLDRKCAVNFFTRTVEPDINRGGDDDDDDDKNDGNDVGSSDLQT